jgi:hypothetical protein
MDPLTPVPIKQLRGQVTRGEYGKGSKSERDAVFVDTGSKRYILRRKKGPAYGDKALEKYIGHRVVCNGLVMGTTLIAETIDIED